MVLLGTAFSLLNWAPKGADFGLYAGRKVMRAVRVTFSNKKTKRSWMPNVHRKTYFSSLLGVKLQLRMTVAAMRCIDKAGGFDSYVYHTPEHKLQSKLGSYLKEKMKQAIEEKGLEPPPLIKRYPRPPKSVQQPSLNTSPHITEPHQHRQSQTV